MPSAAPSAVPSTAPSAVPSAVHTRTGGRAPGGADAMMQSVRRPAPSFRRTWWSLFTLILLGCLAWAIATPLMASPDEGAHAVRAAGVARGQVLPERHRFVIEAWKQQVPEAYAQSGGAACFGRPLFSDEDPKKFITPACVPQFHGSSRLVTVPTYEFRGFVGYYFITGLPSLIWPARFGLFMMRAVNAVAFAALLASGFASALHRRRRSWAVAGVAIAMTPMAWYLGGTINPNGTEIASAIAFWSTVLALATDDSSESDGRLVVRAGIAGFVLVTMRGLGPGFALMALVAAVLVSSRQRIGALVRRRDARIWSGVVFVGVVLTVAWTFIVGLTLDQPEHPAIGFGDAFRGLPVILRQSVGAMGTYFLPLPFLLLAAWVLIAVLGIAFGVIDTDKRGRIAIGLVALAAITLPITTDGYNIPNIGFPWQGRYGLPLTVGLVILTCWLVDAATPRRRAIGIGMVGVAFVGQLAAFVAIGRRLGMGRVTGTDVLDFVLRPRWEPGLPPGLLLAGMVVACVGVVAIAVAAMRPEPADPDVATAGPAAIGTAGAESPHG
jgi:hypothetical protein